ncbi:hypothetical protein DFH28DRAFT_985893 [Melampsora americana]|nr:hypothetical protein DFH28DRAFT_985893 [Melampsora americana]
MITITITVFFLCTLSPKAAYNQNECHLAVSWIKGIASDWSYISLSSYTVQYCLTSTPPVYLDHDRVRQRYASGRVNGCVKGSIELRRAVGHVRR